MLNNHTLIAFTPEEMGILGSITGYILARTTIFGDSSDYPHHANLRAETLKLDAKIRSVIQNKDLDTYKVIQELRHQGWENAKAHVSGIPCWYKDSENHGFDLWEDEDGYAQESGARIEVMKVLDNNPYSDEYVDPNKERAKRRVAKIRRRMFEEGKDPDND